MFTLSTLNQSARCAAGVDEATMRICMLAACPFPANHGTPGSIREMAEAVTERGHEVHIVTYHFGQDIPVQGPRIHRVTPLTGESAVAVGPTIRRPLYDLQMVATALRVIHDHGCDLIHAHGYEAALVAWLCRLATGRPIVYSGHNTMADELPSYGFIRPRLLAHALARGLDAFVPRLANRCLPHSANMEAFFRGMGLATRTEPAVPFGIDVDKPASGDGAAVRIRHGLSQERVVLYMGVLDEFQRLDLLLEAMKEVAWRFPRVKLLVVVTIPHAGHLHRLRSLSHELEIADRVVLTDPQPLEAIPGYLAACDVAVVPRPQAPGFPIKLLNYMAAGKACVLFASSASTGLVHGENAFLAGADTSAALAEGLLEVLRDDALRRRLARNGRQFVRAHHDRRLVARQVCEVYHRTLIEAGRSLPASRQRIPGPAIPWAAVVEAAAGESPTRMIAG